MVQVTTAALPRAVSTPNLHRHCSQSLRAGLLFEEAVQRRLRRAHDYIVPL